MQVEDYANLFFDNLHIVVIAIIFLSFFLNVYFRGKKMDKLKTIAQQLGLEFSNGGTVQSNSVGGADGRAVKASGQIFNIIGNLTGVWAIKGTLNQVQIDISPHRVSKNNYYTAFRAYLSKPYDYQFEVSKENILMKMLSGVGVLQDIKTGNAEVDSEFLIKGQDENKIKQLFSNPALASVLRDLGTKYDNATMKFTNEYLELQFVKIDFEMEIFREIIAKLADSVKSLQS